MKCTLHTAQFYATSRVDNLFNKFHKIDIDRELPMSQDILLALIKLLSPELPSLIWGSPIFANCNPMKQAVIKSSVQK